MNVAGYLFTYWHTKTADARKANIERINEQLRELYGPLLSCITATESTYKTMLQAAPLSPQPGQSRAQAFREAIAAEPHGRLAQAYRCESLAVPTILSAETVLQVWIDLIRAMTPD